ncbi:MAG: BREX-2 system phosphatase PglZ [Acidimicrobiaceae bacterium]|nr:BREX-2 system phosphatase PglZ [Ilumatobacter sp.]MCB0981380.1 BREX-2 system phosphatase PglZ [Ilumatobacter sp.]MCB9380365.1 BREX-2 system phosphatase PglZ [Acidimicrobiaceae bacterium]
MPAADAQQLLALVNSVRRQEDRRLAIAVRVDPVWAGPDTLDGPVPIRIVPCPSPLAVREALAEHERTDNDQVVMLLTGCGDSELGPDVVARLAKGRVVSLDPFTSVLGLFRAAVLDPALTRSERWLVDELIELAPPGGWPREAPVPGVLDLETAWRAWHGARLGFTDIPATLTDVLAVAERPGVPARVAALTPERRASLAGRWAHGAAPTAVLVELIAGGRAADLVSLGLVAGALWEPTDDTALAQSQVLGRVRLEGTIGRDTVDQRSAAAWAAAATAMLGHGAASLWIDRAEQILHEAAVADLAVLSDLLPSGFELRLERLAAQITAGRVADAEATVAALARHRQGSRRNRRLAAATAAVRLLRRAEYRSAPSTVAAHLQAYASDGAWVEAARRALVDAEQRVTITAAYAAICERTVVEQRATDLAFARHLATWSASEPAPNDSIVPIEQVLDRVVAPVAAAQPVVVLVCDGMALNVLYELLRDIADDGWTPAAPVDVPGWPVGVAMLPTVTEVSRASLLAGARIEGGQAEERNGFANHPGLRTASAGHKAPVLFHKAQLVAPAGSALSDTVRSALLDPAQRVVGVVVNSVDDHLSRGDQVRVDWTLESLGPVPWILDAAAEANRVVVLTADHGHVLHGEGAASRPHTDGGERWRRATGAVQPDEIEVHGPRVLKGGTAVLAVDDRLRYGGFKYGYHGGASLHEVAVPVTVLARVLPEGWERRPLLPPAWWAGSGNDVPATAQPPLPSPPKVVRRPTTVGQSELFEPADVESPSAPTTPAISSTPHDGQQGWLGGLFASPTFQGQRHRVRLPRPMDDDRVGRYLTAVAAQGGTIELPALAARLGEPADQLRMALTLVQRLVNIDGAEILAVRAGTTVELNVELLRQQFEVGQ